MKKQGILNSHISKVLADFGHTDWIVVADAGLPIPDGVQKIDLALTLGVPRFTYVVDALVEDMIVEKAIVAEEIKKNNKSTCKYMAKGFQNIEYVSHEEFKELTKNAKAIIRTGEVTPYANCILQAGVIF